MNYSKYLPIMENTAQAELVCGYCGSIALSPDGKDAICHFCENHANISKDNAAKDPAVSQLNGIQISIGKNEWDVAASATDALIVKSTDPIKLYFAANFYKAYSDFKYYSRNYSLMGYMEPNSANIYSSLDLISKSKEYFYKTIKLISDNPDASKDINLIYTKFISQVKLGRLVDAYDTMKTLNSLSNVDIVSYYSSMVYSVESNSKDADLHLERMLSTNHANAFYYLAKYLVRTKKLNAAQNVLEKLLKKVRMPMAFYLLDRIKEVKEETRL